MVPIERRKKDTASWTSIWVQLFVTALLAGSTSAQVAQPDTATGPRQKADPTRALTIPDVDPDYVIRANDVLSLEVQGRVFKLICLVLNDGTIAVPPSATQTEPIGLPGVPVAELHDALAKAIKVRTEYVKAQDLTLAQLQAVLTEKSKRPVKVSLYRHDTAR